MFTARFFLITSIYMYLSGSPSSSLLCFGKFMCQRDLSQSFPNQNFLLIPKAKHKLWLVNSSQHEIATLPFRWSRRKGTLSPALYILSAAWYNEECLQVLGLEPDLQMLQKDCLKLENQLGRLILGNDAAQVQASTFPCQIPVNVVLEEQAIDGFALEETSSIYCPVFVSRLSILHAPISNVSLCSFATAGLQSHNLAHMSSRQSLYTPLSSLALSHPLFTHSKLFYLGQIACDQAPVKLTKKPMISTSIY